LELGDVYLDRARLAVISKNPLFSNPLIIFITISNTEPTVLVPNENCKKKFKAWLANDLSGPKYKEMTDALAFNESAIHLTAIPTSPAAALWNLYSNTASVAMENRTIQRIYLDCIERSTVFFSTMRRADLKEHWETGLQLMKYYATLFDGNNSQDPTHLSALANTNDHLKSWALLRFIKPQFS
jgi:hypothetical protein